MTTPPSVRTERRPSDLLTRVVAWPPLLLLVSGTAGLSQRDGLVGALLGLVVLAVACGVLAAVDGAVLRPGQVVRVWAATLLVLALASRSVGLPALVQAAPLMGESLASSLLPTLPWWFPATSVALLVPVTLGALLGRRFARAELPSTFGPLGPHRPVG